MRIGREFRIGSFSFLRSDAPAEAGRIQLSSEIDAVKIIQDRIYDIRIES